MFTVGDKVVLNDGICIGTVIRLTDKRQDVVVDFGRIHRKFSQTGREVGGDRWSCNRIQPLTDELQKKIQDRQIVAKCKRVLSDASLRIITPDKARKIINFFEQEIFE